MVGISALETESIATSNAPVEELTLADFESLLESSSLESFVVVSFTTCSLFSELDLDSSLTDFALVPMLAIELVALSIRLITTFSCNNRCLSNSFAWDRMFFFSSLTLHALWIWLASIKALPPSDSNSANSNNFSQVC